MAEIRTVINEGTTGYLTCTFKDKDGADAVPASATYRIIDHETGTEILAETAITPIAATVEIKITGDQNQMQNETLDLEDHCVVVVASYGVGDTATDEYIFTVKNLHSL